MWLDPAKSDTSFESFANSQAFMEETNKFFTKYENDPVPFFFFINSKWSQKLSHVSMGI